jgi:hypothetical protein
MTDAPRSGASHDACMTQLTLPAPASTSPWVGASRIGSIVSATVLAGLGLVIASTGIALPVVDSVLASGRVIAPARDVAIFESILPFWGLIVAFGAAVIAGAVGALDQGRIGRLVAIAAAGMILVPAVWVQLAGSAGAVELDVAGRAVAATISGLAGVALLGVAISTRR